MSEMLSARGLGNLPLKSDLSQSIITLQNCGEMSFTFNVLEGILQGGEKGTQVKMD